MRRLVGLASVLLLVGVARADASPAPASYFLAGNPHVPLAVVKGGVIASAVRPDERGKTCGPRTRWSTARSRWRAIDAWGSVVGTYTLRAGERYDVTGCWEVSFASPPPHDRTLLFVSEDSAWSPSASLEWKPSAGERAAFAGMLARIGHGHSQTGLPETLSEVKTETRFFEDSGTKMAIGGKCGGWIVASLANGAWSVVSQERSSKTENRLCYRPLAVFDMNGDGAPEIVLRFTEGDGEWWGESVLERGANGRWSEVAGSPGGSTA